MDKQERQEEMEEVADLLRQETSSLERPREGKRSLNHHRSEPSCLRRQTSDTSFNEYNCARLGIGDFEMADK